MKPYSYHLYLVYDDIKVYDRQSLLPFSSGLHSVLYRRPDTTFAVDWALRTNYLYLFISVLQNICFDFVQGRLGVKNQLSISVYISFAKYLFGLRGISELITRKKTRDSRYVRLCNLKETIHIGD